MKLQKEYHLSVLPWTGCTSSKKIWMVRLLQCLFEYNESPRSTALSSGLHHSTEHHIPPYILWLGEPCNSASRTRHGWVKRGIVNYARATVANWWTNRNTGSLDLHQLHSLGFQRQHWAERGYAQGFSLRQAGCFMREETQKEHSSVR